ncbi:unnamed protein product [Aureobasidium uvarum]|uniref:BTB domain-containing protein n=1 Tax=Aureobasidium uvarum TaxID=2773716 RepID=A0A9N8K8V6_9PEZI|nr:unnamed protein product [Aureobasidium uvarum]
MAPTTPKTPKKATPGKRVLSTALPSPASPTTRVRKSQKDAPDLGSEMVIVLLGDGPKDLRQTKIFHRNLLMPVSGFFSRGLTSGFREAATKIFELEEEDSATFSVFEQWVYRDPSAVTASASAAASDAEDDDQQEWECLPRLYTLGERLDAPKFKDAVVSAIIEKVAETEVMPDNWASYVYQNTVSGNALRRLIVDFHVFAHQSRLLKKGACPDAVEPEYEFLQDVVQRIAEVGLEVFTAGGEMPWTDACVYHEHEQGACHLAAAEEDVVHTVYSLYGTPETPLRRSALAQLEVFEVNEPRPLVSHLHWTVLRPSNSGDLTSLFEY